MSCMKGQLEDQQKETKLCIRSFACWLVVRSRWVDRPFYFRDLRCRET